MKLIDMVRMSLSNLIKRKLRTILTVMGVTIGVVSIVLMVALGLGLEKSVMDSYSQYASLTQVQVNQPYNEPGTAEKDKKFLDQELVDLLCTLDHVESVDPILETNLIIKDGKYQSWCNLRAMPYDALLKQNFVFREGEMPERGETEPRFIFGNYTLENFYVASTGTYAWEKNDGTNYYEDINLMKDSAQYIFDTDRFWGGTDENGNPLPKAKKHMYKAAGIAGEEGQWYQYSYYTYCDIDALIPVLKREFKGRAIPGQPTDSKGKPYKEIYYTTLNVNVDEMENVTAVAQMIKDLGYECYTNAEWLEADMKTMSTIRLVLGGIGAVSLLVAAIGITNTMMMSIYERTKEIGIMKVLGCDMRTIGGMFLTEAAFIGLFGGFVGLLLSYGGAALINKVVGPTFGAETICMITPTLALGSLVFATAVGMISGFFPARRAMHLSALAAMRNE